MLAPGAVIADRFELVAQAGAGGMGEVWHARDRASGVEVALKVVRQLGAADLVRFEREADVLERLAHPGIARHVAHGRGREGPFLAMEWVEGSSLARALRERAPSVDETLALARALAPALACAHDAGVVHRDLKPANVLLRGGDFAAPLLIDFGVARLAQAPSELTSAGEIVGTPGYMAPEQARGEASLGPAADVFSLGCVLYRCLAGRPPFEGESLVAVLAKVLLDEVPGVRAARPEVPAWLEALVAAMLAKDPARRPQGGAELARRLGEARVPELAPEVEPQTLTEREQRLVTLVLARPPARSADETPTVVDRSDLREELGALGARLEWLVDGTAVVALVGRGDAGAQAALAARCARFVADALPGWAVALATGLGRLDRGVPIGQVIDRAAALCGPGAHGAIVLDDVTAGLLDARFDVVVLDGRRVLAGERASPAAARTLLGRPAPFVGRERELAMLTALFEECVAEGARAAIVVGAAGVGKSRLRDELVRAVMGSARAWVGRADPVASRAPLSLLAGAVRRAARVVDNEPAGAQREKLGAFAASLGGGDALAADLLAHVGTGAHAHEGRGDALGVADRARRFFEDLLARAAGAAPLVLVLEDLQWADAASVAAVDGALRRAAALPLFVLGVGRPEIEEVFPRLWAQRGAQPVVLRELGKRAAERLVRDVLGAAATPELAERLAARSGGNAFYLEELIRAVAERGPTDALPETVMAMAGVRLDQLDPAERKLLRAGSVFGGVFWERGVAALLGEDERAVSAGFGELEARELVSARASARLAGERELVFRHALLREAAYASLTEADRTLGHRLAAEWLASVGEPDQAALAEHFERAGDARAAARWARAAVAALEGGDMDAAVLRAGRALEGVGAEGLASEEQARARLVLAEVHRWRGDYAKALDVAKAALALAPPSSALAFDAAGEIALGAGRVGDAAALDEAAARLAAEHPGAAQADAWAIAASRAAAYLYFRGAHAPADALLRRFEALELGAGARARLHQTRSIRAQLDGDDERVIEELLAAETCYVEAGDVRGTCNVRTNVGFALAQVGRWDDAERRLALCLADAERFGLGAITAGARSNLVLVLAGRGRAASARSLADESLAELDRQGDARMAASTCCYVAAALRRADDPAAVAYAERAVAYAEGTTFSPMALAVLALARLDADPEDALARAREAKAALDAAGGVEEGEAHVRLAWAAALERSGDPDAAAARADAIARLDARAARIRDDATRAAFLAIPEHAETARLGAVS